MKAHDVSGLTATAEPQPSALRALESFWFEPADPTLLGLIRFCMGCVMVYVYLTYSIGLIGLVGPDAWVDEHLAEFLTQKYEFYAPPSTWDERSVQPVTEKGYYYASVYYHVTNPAWIWVIHLSILTVIVLFTIGFQTRITTVLTWLGAMCYLQRTPPTLFGMDTMTNILLLYLMIGPCGAALSVDRWLEVRRLRRRGVKHIEPPAPQPMARVALRLIQIHFCLIYFFSGTAKLQGPAWWTGSALWQCIANFTFANVNSSWYVELLKLLSRNRLIWELAMTGGVAYTLLLEISLPFCIWSKKLRPYYMIASILMHLGIGLLMNLGTFSMMMFCMVLAFTPPELVRPLLESFRRRREPATIRQTATATLPAKPQAMAVTG